MGKMKTLDFIAEHVATSFDEDLRESVENMLYEEGIIPHIQIHDKLCFSTTDHEAELIKQTMEQTIPLEVKNKVDYESGPNWGTMK